jgi:hypothetical protein
LVAAALGSSPNPLHEPTDHCEPVLILSEFCREKGFG